VPESFGKRQRRDARDKKAAAREKRRAARNKRREERASGVLEAGTPLACLGSGCPRPRWPARAASLPCTAYRPVSESGGARTKGGVTDGEAEGGCDASAVSRPRGPAPRLPRVAGFHSSFGLRFAFRSQPFLLLLHGLPIQFPVLLDSRSVAVEGRGVRRKSLPRSIAPRVFMPSDPGL
jgi:hypothetical protein